ncbi:MAG: tetratricopeptide repeat protein, partial [Gammaproteobacteria bacterium]
LEKIAEGQPESAELQTALGQLAFANGELERAEAALTKALTLDAEHERAILLLADIKVQQLDYKSAIEYVKRARKLNPDNQKLRMTHARLLLRDDRREEAKQEFQALVDDVPDNDDAVYALALMALRSDSPEQAEDLFKRLMELGKRKDEAAFYLGTLERDRQRYGEALKYFREVKSGDLRVDAELQMAQVLADQGDVDAARANLAALRERDAELMPRAFLVEAEILRKLERLDESMSVYNLAVGRFPDNTDLLYARALLGEAMGDLGILERDLKRVLEIDEDNVNALNALGYTLADRTERYEEALSLIERALEQRPEDAAILDSMGWVQFKLGNIEEAERYLRRALKADFDGEIAGHLGEVLMQQGRQDEANAIWDEALERDPDDKALKETLKRLRPAQ